MCEPVTLTLALAGMGVSAAGKAMQAKAQREAGKYQQKVAENNAIVAGMQATQRIAQAREQKRKLGLQTAAVRGKGRLAFAAGNVRLGVGSALDWEMDVDAAKALDYDSIDYNAALDVWGLQNQAQNFRAEGELARHRGRMGARATLVSGTGNLLTQGALTAKTF